MTTSSVMELVISPAGEVRCLYGEAVELGALGQARIRRASHVETDERGLWWADLSPAAGPALGPFARRSAALEAEARWLGEHVLGVKG